MKNGAYNHTDSRHQSQDNCPPKKATNKHSEISLETLELLLTSVPDEECGLNTSLEKNQTTDKHSIYSNQVRKILSHKSHYIKRLQHMRQKTRGAEWLHQNLSYFQSRFPWELVSLLENMAHDQSPEFRCRTLKPINHLQSAQSDDAYDEQPSLIEGLSIFTTNIRRLIFNSIESPLSQLNESMLTRLGATELKVWYDWSINIESHFQKIEELISEGQCFFSLRNFRKIQALSISSESREYIQRYLEKFEAE